MLTFPYHDKEGSIRTATIQTRLEGIFFTDELKQRLALLANMEYVPFKLPVVKYRRGNITAHIFDDRITIMSVKTSLEDTVSEMENIVRMIKAALTVQDLKTKQIAFRFSAMAYLAVEIPSGWIQHFYLGKHSFSLLKCNGQSAILVNVNDHDDMYKSFEFAKQYIPPHLFSPAVCGDG